MRPLPTICRIVMFRSRTGNYTVPAIIVATVDTLFKPGVEAGHVPGLSTAEHVHLVVFTPGKPGKRATADDFEAPSEHAISENVAGTYQEWDVPIDDTFVGRAGEVQKPGTWVWPVVV